MHSRFGHIYDLAFLLSTNVHFQTILPILDFPRLLGGGGKKYAVEYEHGQENVSDILIYRRTKSIADFFSAHFCSVSNVTL